MLGLFDELTLIIGCGGVLLLLYLIVKTAFRENRDESAKQYSKGILHRLINKL